MLSRAVLARFHGLWRRFLGEESLGRRGEREAARHLAAQGLEILERNVRARRGEIDLIARDGDTLVFVEVKAWTERAGAERTGFERLDPRKRRALSRSCRHYLQRQGKGYSRHRLDAVMVELTAEDRPRVKDLRWYTAVQDVD